ncbi:LPS export ABC transporter periplasmic protein LptC [Flavobacteriaceae bacterium AU392]|nr:LPS export ABC transporter periplasmic protein LptC [Flavobacteriaceae bacterium]RKM86952.1 LPS export ABC transporter periplasmic protein LptC [Flavobacteriaceae bacterium AU392]
MKYNYKYVIKNMVIVFTMTIFFSCQNNIKEIQNIGLKANEPITINEDANVRYIDSGILKANLISERIINYSNRDFPFYEFPQKVNLYLYDENNNKSNITADYAIVYERTGIIDLRGNVVLVTHTNDTIITDQLFYDKNREWVFTNFSTNFRSKDRIGFGDIFDSDKDFESPIVLGGSSEFDIEE